jgi:hypothetical protein
VEKKDQKVLMFQNHMTNKTARFEIFKKRKETEEKSYPLQISVKHLEIFFKRKPVANGK